MVALFAKAPSFSTNIRLGRKGLPGANGLAYRQRRKYFFCGSNTCGLYFKSFTIVIYNCNDSGLYYKTTIVALYELKL